MFTELAIEIKCSRKNKFSIKERDIKGLSPNSSTSAGFLAALVTSNTHEGPHWVFVPAEKVTPRFYNAKTLSTLHTPTNLLQKLNYLWGDVLLNEELMEKLLNLKRIDLKAMHWWQNLSYQSPHQPLDTTKCPIRSIKVAEALATLRTRLDEKHGRSAPRREGFLHQCILQFCLNKSGHETISNMIGVPDLRTQILSNEFKSNYS